MLYLAYALKSYDTAIKDEDLDKYVTGLWFQRSGSVLTPYLPILCSELPYVNEYNEGDEE